MEWWKLGLEYTKVLFSWPLILFLIVFLLRKPIGEFLLKRNFEAEGAGMRVRVGSAEAAAGEALGYAAQISKADVGDSTYAETDGSPRREAERRRAMEQVLAEGARLGWEWAQSGQDKPPAVVVHWNADGTPRVLALPRSTVLDEEVRASRASNTYFHMLMANLQVAYPGLAVIAENIDHEGPEGMIRIGEFAADLLVEYHELPSKKLSVDQVKRAHSVCVGRILPTLLVTNLEVPNETFKVLQRLNATARSRLYVTSWRDPSQNEELKQVVELMISDTFRNPLRNEG
ncbi:hypothetical protein AAH991_38415 [Microbispora sp. ZYX-F-249]|uniref:Uncharacterized protein n=1 Tax=Microbispora maris TaxID=3144104 RepID=A0ABV0B2K4_9ACTN